MKTFAKLVFGAAFVGTMVIIGLRPVKAGDCKDLYCGGFDSTPTVITTPSATPETTPTPHG